jgi:putative protein-disulfide isomerase
MLRFIFSIHLIFYLNLSMMAQTKAKIIYVADPMCSWCYGFANELSAALKNLDDKVELQLIMGGLRPYNTETMLDLGEFLKGHWQHVEERSGREFNYEILKDSSFVYDTEPPSRAVLVMRQLKPAQEFAFFKAIQTAFYAENKNTNDVNTYLDLTEQFGVDREKFKAMFESEGMKQAIRKDFETAGAMGVRGFPTVILQDGDQYFLISNGYTTAKNIESNISHQLESVEK